MISQMLELAIAQVFARARDYLATVWLSVRIELELTAHRSPIILSPASSRTGSKFIHISNRRRARLITLSRFESNVESESIRV